jgi:hypothetical protein
MSKATDQKGIKINNCEVKVYGTGPPPKKSQGYDMLPYPFAIVLFDGPTGSGKTVGIENMIYHRLPKKKHKIPVILICPTEAQESWDRIVKTLKSRGHPVYQYDSIIDPQTGENNLEEIYTHMKALNRRDPKYKKRYDLRYMLILDDCVSEMRHKSMLMTMAKIRHEKCGIIMAAQSMKNIVPAARSQVRAWALYPQISKGDLKKIYDDANPAIPEEEFYDRYKRATKKTHRFLYMLLPGTGMKLEFRWNFNERDPKYAVQDAELAKR